MNACEMLEAAATAMDFSYQKPVAGYNGSHGLQIGGNPMRTFWWDPLASSTDAAEMCLRLNIQWKLNREQNRIEAWCPDSTASAVVTIENENRLKAWRKASLEVAALIGQERLTQK